MELSMAVQSKFQAGEQEVVHSAGAKNLWDSNKLKESVAELSNRIDKIVEVYKSWSTWLMGGPFLVGPQTGALKARVEFLQSKLDGIVSKNAMLPNEQNTLQRDIHLLLGRIQQFQADFT
jgi:hypothetical protein